MLDVKGWEYNLLWHSSGVNALQNDKGKKKITSKVILTGLSDNIRLCGKEKKKRKKDISFENSWCEKK